MFDRTNGPCSKQVLISCRKCVGNQYLYKLATNNDYRELGSNYLLISRNFKNCMVIRAIYFKVFALANR